MFCLCTLKENEKAPCILTMKTINLSKYGRSLKNSFMIPCAHIVFISCDMLNPSMSGFRPGNSAINHFNSISQAILKASDCNPPRDVCSIYLDISKTIDRILHDGFTYKLNLYSVSGQLLYLIQSFLTDRKQRSVLNRECSSWGDTLAGVPQGSLPRTIILSCLFKISHFQI